MEDERLGPVINVNPKTNRKCRICGKRLNVTNYFHCSVCKNTFFKGTPYSQYDYGYALNVKSKKGDAVWKALNQAAVVEPRGEEGSSS